MALNSKVAIDVQIKNVQKITDLKNSLKALRKEQRDIEKATKDGNKSQNISSKRYKDNAKAIDTNSKSLRNLNRNQKDATKSSNSMAKSFVKGAAAIGIIVGAFRMVSRALNSVISTFTAFEFQMAKTMAITGATEEDFKKLSDTALELGRTTFFTAKQVAELQTNYAKLGFTTDEILKAQASTLQLATVTASDLGRAAIVTGAAVRGFGLDASETGRVVDVMTQAFNSSALDMEKWQTSMTKVAPIAAGMNITLEDTAAIMGVLTDAGIEASIAGTSMRNIFLQMKDPTSKLGEYLGFTVNSSLDLTRALDKLSEASAETRDGLVNIRQVAAMQVMVQGQHMVQLLSDKLYAAAGAAKLAAEIIGDTLQGSFLRLKSASEGLSIELVDKLGGGLQELIDSLATYLNTLTKSSDGLVKTIKFLVQAVKWIGLYKVGTLAAAAAINVTTRALALFNITLRATRAALIRTGVGALAVGLGYLAEKYLFAAGATETLTDATDDYTVAVDKTAQAHERLAKVLSSPLPLTLEEVAPALKEAQEQIDRASGQALANTIKFNAKFKTETAKQRKELQKNFDFDPAYKKLYKEYKLDLETKNAELLQTEYDFGMKKLQILRRQEELIQNKKDKAYKDALKLVTDNNHKKIQFIQNQYLNEEIDKEEFDKKMLTQQQSHYKKMIRVNKLHNKDTNALDDSLLKHKITNFEALKKKAEDITAKDEETTLAWEKIAMMKLVLAGTKSLEDAERELRDMAISRAEAELAAIPPFLINAEYRLELEQKIIDLKLKNLKVTEKGEKASLKALDKEIKNYSDLGSALQTVAGDNKALNGIKEAGIAITRAAAVAESILNLQKAMTAMTEGKLTIATLLGTQATIASTTATAADTVVTGTSLGVDATKAVLSGGKMFPFPFNLVAIAATIAIISKVMKMFEDGGIVDDGKFAKGGMVHGASHANGGVKFAVGGRVNELEGGEAVINKKSTAMFRGQLSEMNQAGGGVKFADGGLLSSPQFADAQFNANNQSAMMGAMGGQRKVVVVEADITDSQSTVSVIQANATF